MSEGQGPYNQGQYGQGQYNQGQYNQGQYDQGQYRDPQYGSGAPGGGTPAYGEPMAAPPRPKNGMGTAALILGILGFLGSFVVIGIVLDLLAIVFGFIGRGRAKRGQATNGGAAMVGIVLGVLGILLAILVAVVFGSAVYAFLNFGGGQTLQQFQDCLSQAQNAPSPAAVQQAVEQCNQQFQQQLPQVPGSGQ